MKLKAAVCSYLRSLIDDCERWEKEGESTTEPERPKTKVTDLQGFWEMVNIQIADVDKLFQDLDKPKGTVLFKLPHPLESVPLWYSFLFSRSFISNIIFLSLVVL